MPVPEEHFHSKDVLGESKTGSKTRHVSCLLIEDSPIDAALIKKIISSDKTYAIQLQVSSSIETAFELIANHNFDIILLELDLPNKHGLDNLTQVLQKVPFLPVIVLTSKDDDKLSAEAVRRGAQDYIVKGQFDARLLKRCIRYAIERKHQFNSLADFQNFFPMTGIGFAVVDINGRLLHANDGLCVLVGERSGNQLLGKKLFDFYTEDSQKKIQKEVIVKVLKRGQWTGELYLKSHNFEEIATVQNVVVFRDRKGEPLCFGYFIIDISFKVEQEKQLIERDRRYKDVFETMAVGLSKQKIIYDQNGAPLNTVILDVNHAFENLTGLEKTNIIGKRITEIFPNFKDPDCDVIQQFAKIAETGGMRTIEQYFRTLNKWFSMTIYGTSREHFVVLFHDITKSKTVDQKLEEAVKRYQNLYENNLDGIVMMDLSGNIIESNQSFLDMMSCTIEEVKGVNYCDLIPGHYFNDQFNDELFKKGFSDSYFREYCRKDGIVFHVENKFFLIRDTNQEPIGIWSVVRDLSDKKKTDEKVKRLSFFDRLTDLPNRMLAIDRVTQTIEKLQDEANADQKAAVLIVDLDQFKIVNDTLGHIYGDKLLVDSSKRIVSLVRKADTVARLGGDEFLIVLSDLEDVNDAAVVAQKILDSFSQPFLLEEREVFITASIGIVVYPNDGKDACQLLKNAESAMYKAKDDLRNTFKFFTPEMNEKADVRIRTESKLRHAIESSSMEIYYQPIYNVISRNLIGCEALLRWNDVDLGSIPPDVFIPLAEDTGLIINLGEWVLQQACLQAKKWERWYEMPFKISVNVSPRQFIGGDIVKIVANSLEMSGLAPQNLELEVTERLLLQNLPKTKEILDRLSSFGVSLSIDDFGTGYSALGYLKKFPFNTLKIDKSFVQEMTKTNQDAALSSAIIALAHGLNLTVVGEGVETEEQLEFLRFQGCDLIQGFYFAKPLSPPDFEKHIKDKY